MPPPETICIRSFGPRKAAGGILLVLCGLFWLLGGCAKHLKTDTEAPELPLVRVIERKLPSFSDDMFFDGLSASIAKSRVYLKSKPPETQFVFGPDAYSANQIIQSLDHFDQFIQKRPSGDRLNRFIKKHYHTYRSTGGPRTRQMLFTGYYEPFLNGSTHKNNRYRYPLYTRPRDLVSINLTPFSEKFKGETLWGRVEGQSVVPYHDREEIDSTGVLFDKASVLAWVDDRIDLFFLHIQGSGKLYMDNGASLNVHYNSPNGRPYRSIGKHLIQNGAIPREKMSMQAIKTYLRGHPDAVDGILNANPSYVFFNAEKEGPIGSLGVQLTPGRSIATDRRIFPKAALAFVQTRKPLLDGGGSIADWTYCSRFVLNQDTGGAIRGPGRADLYWGNGPYAELAAGYMQHPGSLYFLVLKPEYLD